MFRRAPHAIVIVWILTLAAAVWQLSETQWQSSILTFLPSNSDAEDSHLLHRNPANQHIRLLLTGGDAEAYQVFAQAIQAQPIALHWLNPIAEMHALRDNYRAFSGVLATDHDYQRLVTGEYESLIEHAWQQLSSPMPTAVSHLQTDPLMLAEAFVQQAGSPWQDIHRYGFSIQTEPLTWLMIGTLQGDGFDRSHAAALLEAVTTATQQMQMQHPDARVATSGVAFHTAEAAARAEWEINTFSLLSFIGVIALLWLCFGHLKSLVLTVGVLIIALTTGFAVVVLVFDTVHLIALVFATTLVGIAVDYAIHGMLAAGKSARAFQRMLPHLRLGVLTTLMGYIALWLLPFALLQQVAVFIGSGIIAAYAAVHLAFKRFANQPSLQVRPWVKNASESYHRRWSKVTHQGARGLVIVFGIGAVALLGYLQFEDNVVRLTQSSQSLLADERDVQQALQADDTASYWLVQQAASLQDILQSQEQLRLELGSIAAIEAWQMLADQLPSVERQHAVQDALTNLWDSSPGEAYLNELGLPPPPQRSNWLELAHLPAGLQQSVQSDDKGWISFIQIQSQAQWDIEELRLPSNMQWFLPLEDASNALGELRQQLYQWIAIALVVALLMLAWHRGWLIAVSGIVYLIFVLVSALSLSQWLTGPLHVFHLVAVILVLSLAIDYLVFFSSPLQASSIHVAVKLSALTSILAFGLLYFSSTPAISSFGLTILIGISIAALLGPIFTRIKSEPKVGI